MTSRIIRFDGYEADTAAGELRKNGARVPLELQPFQVLAMLLERPGEVVTREEIQEAVWPDVHIDIDTALNTAIRKIRRALDDSATTPKYVETLHKRGYRFMGSVELARAIPPPAPGRGASGRWALLGVAVATAALGLWFWLDRPAPGPWDGPAEIRRLTNAPGLNDQPSISRDGKFVVFASDRADGNLDLWVQQTAGSEATRVTTHPAKDSFPSLTPDGSQIVFHSERDGGGVYIMSVLGGEAPQLVASGGREPQVSPDGKRVVFQKDNAIHWAATSGGATTKVSGGLDTAGNPNWSPDSQKILFRGFRQDRGPSERIVDWWLADVHEASARPTRSYDLLVKSFGVIPDVMFWSEHHQAVVISAGLENRTYSRNRQTRNLWALPFSAEEGRIAGEPFQLTSGGDLRDSASSDALGVITFAETRSNKSLWKAPIDHATGLAEGPPIALTRSETLDDEPWVSEDGRRVIFRRYRSGEFDYWLLDVETKGETQLTRTGTPKHGMPSPDLDSIAYFDQSRREFHVFSPDGSRNVTCSSCGGTRSWTPDSRYVLAGVLPDQRDGLNMADGVQLLDPSSGETHVILDDSEEQVSNASVSSTGEHVVFRLGERMMIAPFRGTESVTRDTWMELLPFRVNPMAWAPAGDRLYYLSVSGAGFADTGSHGFKCIWSIQIDPETGRRIGEPTATRHFHQASEELDAYFGVSRDHLVFSLVKREGSIFLRKPLGVE